MVNNTQTELEEPESGHAAFSLLSILRTIWKRKVRIAMAWVLFTLVGVAVVRMLPAVYLSEAVVLIDSQKIPEKFVSATVASDLEDRIAAIRQMLLSGGELKKIIDDFGLYRDERKTHFEEEILEMMRKDISITLESGRQPAAPATNAPAAFRIGYQGPDPAIVMRVANRLTDLYVEQNLKTRESAGRGHLGVSGHAASRGQEAAGRVGSRRQLLQAPAQRRTAAAGTVSGERAFQASDRTGSQSRRHQPRPADQGHPGRQPQRDGSDAGGADARLGTGPAPSGSG